MFTNYNYNKTTTTTTNYNFEFRKTTLKTPASQPPNFQPYFIFIFLTFDKTLFVE